MTGALALFAGRPGSFATREEVRFAASGPAGGSGSAGAQAAGGSGFFLAPMKTLCVLQHTEAEYLGLMEDHLEARSIRFQYVRPFTPGGMVPESAEGFDGLIVLGAGPLGIVSGSLLPSLAPELRLIADFLKRGLPVTGIGLGAVLLAVAAGGGAEEAPLRFEVASARSKAPGALGGHLPETIPVAIYMRDAPVLPDDAQVLAEGEGGEPVVFALHGNCFGFLGHPGAKSAMIEDLIMEFDEAPDDTAAKLEALRTCQAEITEALSQIMVGIVHDSGWMTVPQGEALS